MNSIITKYSTHIICKINEVENIEDVIAVCYSSAGCKYQYQAKIAIKL
jgi:hypothetical protein